MANKKSPKTFSLISRRKLLALYTTLLRCRMMTEVAAAKARRNKAAHEAPAVAVVFDFKPGDTIVAAESDFLPEFVKGASPEKILASLGARTARARAPFAATLKATLAAARIHAQRKSRNIAAVFGNGASVSSAAWSNALRIAASERLPILFVSQPGADQPRGNASPDFPVIPVDGDDVVALYRVASEAQAHARRGNGPTLIECIPWPLALQDGASAASDSILSMECYLANMGIPFERSKRKAIEQFGPSLRGGGASVRARVKAIKKTTR
jgi:TPP-dependent pyruvate/acetoin dehydrogenase alpha subunit